MPKEIHQIQPIQEASKESLNRLVEELNIRLFEISKNLPESSTPTYYAKLSDVKDYNVGGGTFTQDAWRTRDLNTQYDPNEIVTLSSNQFTLQAGTYRIKATAPALQVGNTVARLYNISDSSQEILGSVRWTNNAGTYVTSDSFVVGEFTITSAKTFEIQHYCSVTKASNGLGSATNVSGIDSIYTIVEIWQVA